MYYDYISNVLNVLFLCSVVIWIDLSLNKKYSSYILGVLFGLITIFLMNDKFMIDHGRIFDFQHITMTMAGFIGGPVTAVIATIISCLYRYHMGVSGSMYGITVIIVFACFGSFLGMHFRSNQNGKKVLFWFVIGIVMACIMLLIVAFIPSWTIDSRGVFIAVFVPIIIMTPLVMTLIFNLYFWAYKFFSKSLILSTILNCSPINLMVLDTHGPILLSENIKTQLNAYPFIEKLFSLSYTDKTWRNTKELQHREITTEDESYFVAESSSFQMINGEYACVVIVNDVTELKRIQKEIAHLDRLNLVGQVAAGIAHEIRNPMTTVRGYLQLLAEKPDYVAQKSTFELMISEVDRANGIITEFLSLAQTKPTELKPQNLNDILNNLYPLIEADAFTQNKQIYFIPGEIPNLELDRNEISQMVLNLARNGLDAMEERGSLTIKSYVENSKVVLAIVDEGCGIPPENMSKIGTPFFTSKDNGTGLGLATCYKIAESHQAKVFINSSPIGTTFFIHFPIPDRESEQNGTSA